MARLGCLAVALLVVAALWADGSYLAQEHRRLEPWKIAELWCADMVALWWFVRFAIVHAIQGEPLSPLPLEDGKKQMRGVAITGVTVLAVDLVLTLSLMYDERVRYSQGAITNGQV